MGVVEVFRESHGAFPRIKRRERAQTTLTRPILPLLSFRLGDLKPVEEIGSKAKEEGCLVEAAHYGVT